MTEWKRRNDNQLSLCPTSAFCQDNNFSVASCMAIATTFLIQIPKEILFFLFWEAWQGVSSFVCLTLYYKQFLQPWHTQMQIALLFGSYLWTGAQDKVSGRLSLATACCLLQHILNKPIWGIPWRKIYWNAFNFFFFLSVKQLKLRRQCSIYYFYNFSLSFVLSYLNTRNRKYHWSIIIPIFIMCWKYTILVLAVILSHWVVTHIFMARIVSAHSSCQCMNIQASNVPSQCMLLW